MKKIKNKISFLENPNKLNFLVIFQRSYRELAEKIDSK